jgi:Tol biopolymer transport system component
MKNKIHMKLLSLVLLVILGQGCVSDAHPASTPTATSQPIISVPPTTTPTTIVVKADFSQTGWFVYVCNKESGWDLCLVSPDQQEIVAMGLEKLGDISSPTWSPDGRTIAFVVQYQFYSDIFLVDVNCVNTSGGCLSASRKVSPDQPGQYSYPDWSPDGRKIAYTFRMGFDYDDNIWVMNADGTNPTRLTEIDGYDPKWSPDGNEIAFVSFENYNESIPGLAGDVFVMNKDGSNVHQLTETLRDSGSPEWSPDGEWLIVASSDGKDPFEASSSLIFKIRVDGSEMIRLGEGGGGVWSPDGEVIAFLKDLGLWFMDANGMNLQKVGEISTYEPICWQPYGIVPQP